VGWGPWALEIWVRAGCGRVQACCSCMVMVYCWRRRLLRGRVGVLC